MPTGTVKFYKDYMGYGFIISDYDGKEIFVHHTEIKTANKILKEGQKVEFKIKESPKGLSAVKVNLI